MSQTTSAHDRPGDHRPTADGAASATPAPDNAAPDNAAPDNAAPDNAAPDSTPHDTPARDAGRPTTAQRRASRIVGELFSNLATGRVTVVLPDGRRRNFGRRDRTSGNDGGQRDDGLSARIVVHDWSFFPQLLHGASVGAGASYIEGAWSCDDLVSLLRILIANRDAMRRVTPAAVARIAGDRALHSMRGNRRSQATRNIAAHYDLSNALYALFLDETMTYSAGVFPTPDASLADAQREKYRRLAERAGIGPGMRVLEIGCGWGGFAEYAAREIGCHVTGITLSESQAEHARDRVRRAGLEESIDIEVVDYRDVNGSYDRIVSIEMLEAVGHRYLGVFFSTVDRLLAPDGVAAIQVITIPDQRYATYRRRPDFIQRFVFPGGHLPSLEALTRAMRRGSTLVIEDIDNIGMHYAETLRRWRLRFLANADHVRVLGFDDEFLRLWGFYLAYCEAAFRARWVNDLQLTLSRPGNQTLGTGPYGA